MSKETYQVTARKWRPKNFLELKGQEHIAKTLGQIINSKKIAHSYLFSGPRGVGKTTTARIMAKCLNCEEGPTLTPCDKCNNCIEIANGISPDVYEIDGASNRGIEQIRELRENVRYMPAKSRYKIFIIDEVHMLTTEAFNALLKTLEEPPEHIIFIFATTEPHKVKITIRSRCQHFHFKRMSLNTLKDQIKLILNSYKIKFDDESVEAIARASDGSMRDSQSIMDQVIAYCGDNITIDETRKVLGISGDEKYYDFLNLLTNKDVSGLMVLLEDIVTSGADLSTFALGLMNIFRNLTIIKALPKESPAILDISNEQIAELKKFAERFDVYQLREITRKTIKLNNELKYTSNQRFSFESFIFDIIDYENLISFSDVLKRIERIEKELTSISDAEITISDDYIQNVLSKLPEITSSVKKNSQTVIEEKPLSESNNNTQQEKEFIKEEKTLPKNFASIIAEHLKTRQQMFTAESIMKIVSHKLNENNNALEILP